MSYSIGDRYWVPDDEHAWLIGTLKELKNSVLEFNVEKKGVKKFRTTDLKIKIEACGSHIDDNVENLVDLDELSEGAILHHVRSRFLKKTIYTHVGSILVAVNPFERLNIYGDVDIRRAHESTVSYPHVFVTAANAYQQLSNNCKDQSVLISGESGAGKTETTKKVLTFLANVAPDSKPKVPGEPGVETKILQSNPLLEALGNAKTLRNNNSSRFGKWMKVGFDSSFRIEGCEIINYLLEKSRVVGQNSMERNYHIFYQLLVGADGAMKQRLSLKAVDDYHYLNTSGCTKIEGVDDAEEFREVLQAMQTLQFSGSTCESMFRILAGVLILGNVELQAGAQEDSSDIKNESLETLQKCGDLLGLEMETLKYALTHENVQSGKGSVIVKNLTLTKAIDARDTISKALYSNMFDWTIKQVNSTLKTEDSKYTIGILDIFGFEVFELNSFEQLCINYANEKLQFHFNEVIFNEERAMYESEGVSTEKVVFEDNGECVNLIEGKSYGLLSLLEDECSLGGKANDLTYLNKVDKHFGSGKSKENKFYKKDRTKPDSFSVCHFAGAVEYNVTGFLEKSKDSLSLTARETMQLSQIPLVVELFQETATGDAPVTPTPSSKKSSRSTKRPTKSTLGGQFRTQLIGLVSTLKATEPHFIRCVKPNHAKIGGAFDGTLALRQLRYAGLFEAIRIRKSGFAYRAPFRVFVNNYQIQVDGLLTQRRGGLGDREACEVILKKVTQEKLLEQEVWHVGTTKVFLKANIHRTILERQKIARVSVYVVRIQRCGRRYLEKLRLYMLNKEKYMEQERLAKYEKMKHSSATMVQKHWRRTMVRLMMRSMNNLIDLRRVLAQRDLALIREKLEAIDLHLLTADTMMATMFTHEVKVAKVMMRLIEVQDKLVEDVKTAMENTDVAELNRLLLKSERLEMDTHPVVLEAKEELTRLHKKRKIMKAMVAFLRNEDEFTENILETLDEAQDINVDGEFISKVKKVYDNAGPRLKARNRLRNGLELVDVYEIEQSCLEILAIQKMQSNFAESELRAARSMLRLLHFDAEVHGTDGGDEGSPERKETEESSCHSYTSLWGKSVHSKPTGPKLEKDLVDICDSIATARTAEAVKEEKKKLLDRVGSVQTLYEVIRYFKWSKTLCTWRYSEVQSAKPASSYVHFDANVTPAKSGSILGAGHDPGALRSSISKRLSAHKDTTNPDEMLLGELGISEELGTDQKKSRVRGKGSPRGTNCEVDFDFYGLRPHESKSNPYIIRTLHKDFDIYTGASTALMQAAMSSIDLPSSVTETLRHLDSLLNFSNASEAHAEAKKAKAVTALGIKLIKGTTKSPLNSSATKTAGKKMQVTEGSTREKQLVKKDSFMSSNGPNESFYNSTSAKKVKLVMKSSLPKTPVKRIDNLPPENLEKQLLKSRENKAEKWKTMVRSHEKDKRTAVNQGWR